MHVGTLNNRQVDWIRKIVESNSENDRLFKTLVEKNQVHWKRRSPDEILRWLHNFSNENEVHCALVLADNILYYNLDDIRSLYRYILTNKVKIMLINEKFKSILPVSLDSWFADYLRDRCLFVSFGRASKSAPSMGHFFKQSHNIEGLKYRDLCQFLLQPGDLKDIEKVFLIDDFLGSGKQASVEWNRRVDDQNVDSNSLEKVKRNNPHVEFIYLALVGCEVGRRKIEMSLPIKVVVGEELDERFKCFSNISVVFKDPNLRTEARKVMEEKGKILYEFPLGFDNMELAVAFDHNTPDNSLPVIWKNPDDGSWYPLFERFE